ncbi:MAG: N-acetyl-gamma-glutamyl-phosphate reductase [Clostridia bacterium]|nr:N-acetyl-gamma-glutamyl-phosphate reductase [Clostridia bacterium]
MLKVGIIGATGYTGAELVRLLSRHPQVELVALTSQSYAGEDFASVYPALNGYIDLQCADLSPQELLEQVDLAFIALPHGHAFEVAKEAARLGKRLIDLGADFRFRRAETYTEWYGLEHGAPELTARAVYGLPEVYRDEIRQAQLVANPGCYPTSAILALAPLLKEGLIDLDTIIIDAKSGVSGAGRKAVVNSLFVECNENIHAYGVAGHRHTPEIEQALSFLAGQEVRVSFTPHLVPMSRGILSTIYVRLNREITGQDLHSLYRAFYGREPFVRVLPPGRWPHTRWVYGSNYCDLGLAVDRRTGRAIIVSAIDNLTKGASGQAVQNMNIMCGFEETAGLDYPGLCP